MLCCFRIVIAMIPSKLSITLNSIFCVILCFISEIESKYCHYIPLDESEQVHVFRCSAFETCCGKMCCKMRGLSLYQVWYFWLFVVLLFLLCSGGGFWARRQYYVRTEAAPIVTTATIPSSHTPNFHPQPPDAAVFYTIGASKQQPSYSTIVWNASPGIAQSQPSCTNSIPPPYTGPPPSYETIYNSSHQQSSQPK